MAVAVTSGPAGLTANWDRCGCCPVLGGPCPCRAAGLQTTCSRTAWAPPQADSQLLSKRLTLGRAFMFALRIL